jgi:hypothetical protein
MRHLFKLTLAICLIALSPLNAAKKAVHVRGYTRKDGTVVHAHGRSAPTKHTVKKAAPAPAAKSVTGPGSIHRNSKGRIARSEKAKKQFEASHPCPATGKASGSCPGYIVDHVKPLACGGADAPENMQWQTLAASKAKDAWERKGCRP